MNHDSAFLFPSTLLGRYWTQHARFDLLFDKDDIRKMLGRRFGSLVFLDPAVAFGPACMRANSQEDDALTSFFLRHLHEIRSEFTVFVTTADILQPEADENTPVITESDDPFVQNRIKLHNEINLHFGRVLNVHLTEIAHPSPDFNPMMHSILNPPEGTSKLPLPPLEFHQLYFPTRIKGDVERCVPLGISRIIPAAPPLTTTEIVKALKPELLDRLPDPAPEDPFGSRRTSVHSFQWLDPKDGYLVSKSDQLTLLEFYYGL